MLLSFLSEADGLLVDGLLADGLLVDGLLVLADGFLSASALISLKYVI